MILINTLNVALLFKMQFEQLLQTLIWPKRKNLLNFFVKVARRNGEKISTKKKIMSNLDKYKINADECTPILRSRAQ